MKYKFIHCRVGNCKLLDGRKVLIEDIVESDLDYIWKFKYYLYSFKLKQKKELIKGINKYNIWSISNLQINDESIYYTTFNKNLNEVNMLKYDIVSETTSLIFKTKDNLKFYPNKKYVKAFILDENYLIIQKGYLQEKRLNDFGPIGEFELFLHDIYNNVNYLINDNRLISDGIYKIFLNSDNLLIIQTGTTLREQHKENYFDENEAPNKYIFTINKSYFANRIIENKDYNFDIVEEEKWNTAINNIKMVNKYLIYSKTYFPSKEKKYFLYKTEKAEMNSFKKKKRYKEHDILRQQAIIIEDEPYEVIYHKNGTEFINLKTMKKNSFKRNIGEIKYIEGNNLIVEGLYIYKFPEMKIVKYKKGDFHKVIRIKEKIYILYF